VQGQDFFLLHSVQTGSETHAASYPMGNRGSFPWGVTRPGRVADHLPLSSAEVKNGIAIFPLPICLHDIELA
jgi:hypothetical protein